MSGLADQFVSNGEADIYQETYERLKSKLDRLQASTVSKTTDPEFDMYGDSDIALSVSKPTTATTTAEDKGKTRNGAMQAELIVDRLASTEVLWEYTMDENSPSELQGPFTTQHMIRLTETEGKLDKDKVRCRRVGTQQFYSIKRIDFDLYLD